MLRQERHADCRLRALAFTICALRARYYAAITILFICCYVTVFAGRLYYHDAAPCHILRRYGAVYDAGYCRCSTRAAAIALRRSRCFFAVDYAPRRYARRCYAVSMPLLMIRHAAALARYDADAMPTYALLRVMLRDIAGGGC